MNRLIPPIIYKDLREHRRMLFSLAVLSILAGIPLGRSARMGSNAESFITVLLMFYFVLQSATVGRFLISREFLSDSFLHLRGYPLSALRWWLEKSLFGILICSVSSGMMLLGYWIFVHNPQNAAFLGARVIPATILFSVETWMITLTLLSLGRWASLILPILSIALIVWGEELSHYPGAPLALFSNSAQFGTLSTFTKHLGLSALFAAAFFSVSLIIAGLGWPVMALLRSQRWRTFCLLGSLALWIGAGQATVSKAKKNTELIPASFYSDTSGKVSVYVARGAFSADTLGSLQPKILGWINKLDRALEAFVEQHSFATFPAVVVSLVREERSKVTVSDMRNLITVHVPVSYLDVPDMLVVAEIIEAALEAKSNFYSLLEPQSLLAQGLPLAWTLENKELCPGDSCNKIIQARLALAHSVTPTASTSWLRWESVRQQLGTCLAAALTVPLMERLPLKRRQELTRQLAQTPLLPGGIGALEYKLRAPWLTTDELARTPRAPKDGAENGIKISEAKTIAALSKTTAERKKRKNSGAQVLLLSKSPDGFPAETSVLLFSAGEEFPARYITSDNVLSETLPKGGKRMLLRYKVPSGSPLLFSLQRRDQKTRCPIQSPWQEVAPL